MSFFETQGELFSAVRLGHPAGGKHSEPDWTAVAVAFWIDKQIAVIAVENQVASAASVTECLEPSEPPIEPQPTEFEH